MKKHILFAIIFILSVTSVKSQTYKYIPDANFRTYLRVTLGLPFNPSGDSLNISSTAVTNRTFISCSSRSISSLEGIQYFTALSQLSCDYNSITSIDTLPNSLTDLSCTFNNINHIANLPPSLIKLYCGFNNLTSLPVLNSTIKELDFEFNYVNALPPTLPSSILVLNGIYNNITSLPVLPPNLTNFGIGHNNVTILPTLPNSIKYLYIYNTLIDTLISLPDSLRIINLDSTNISSLPTLPYYLESIYSQYTHITSFPTLPNYLEDLSCSNNNLGSLPALPSRLRNLYCNECQLTSLPVLSDSLIYIECARNLLTSFPTIPNKLTYLYAFNNDILYIPNFNNKLVTINCSNNLNLSCLPKLPSTLRNLSYINTNISCLPNIVSAATYTPPYTSLPICNPYISSCPYYLPIGGITYLDNDTNCIVNSTDDSLGNIPIIERNGSTVIQTNASDVNGQYAFEAVPSGIYTTFIDSTNIPFYVSCPVSGFDTVTVDSLHLYNLDRNFALKSKPGYDLISQSLVRRSNIRPAAMINFDVNSGDIGEIYGKHLTNISGEITLFYNGPQTYRGVTSGTLIPDSIFADRLVWRINNFTTHDFYNSIKPIFQIDSAAVIGDIICFTTTVFPFLDRDPTNNIFQQCFDVRTSYDPNIKEVNPSGSITSSQDWLYYTIHFQNTGNSYAQNIYVWDTIDPNLNLNTIQVMGASHNQFMQIFNSNRSVRFNFININLEDSTTNEPASHGWVQYRIKPNASLAEGTNIRNTASILFDLNAPVVTNTVTTNICNTTTTTTQTKIINEGDVVQVGSHTYSQSGSYTDILSNIHGCDSTVNTIIQIVNGQLEINAINFIVYPNPTNNQVFIQLEGMPADKLNIVDMYGRKVFESDIISNKFQINTENWSNGTYMIQCGSSRAKMVVGH